MASGARPGAAAPAARPSPRDAAAAPGRGADAGEVVGVLVADRDPLARRALRDAVGAGAGVRMLGEAATAEAAIELAERLSPDVILIGSQIGDDVTALTRALAERLPRARIVVLAAHADEPIALPALRAGAIGFIPRDVSAEALPRIVRGVAAGEAALPRALTGRLAERVRSGGRGAARRPGTLSARERELVELLADGLTPTAVAQRLRLPPEAVRALLRSVMLKLGVRTRSEAIAVARRVNELATLAGTRPPA